MCKWFFYSFFLSPLSNYFSSPTFTTTQCGKIRRRKKKITTQPPNPVPPPNTKNNHWKTQLKINQNSSGNPTQNTRSATARSATVGSSIAATLIFHCCRWLGVGGGGSSVGDGRWRVNGEGEREGRRKEGGRKREGGQIGGGLRQRRWARLAATTG